MGTNRKIRHHTVPQNYLKYFADSKEQLLIANFSRLSSNKSSIKNVSVHNGFYSLPLGATEDIIETKLLADLIESPASSVLEKIINGYEWPLNVRDRFVLANFIAMQLLRTPDKREYYNYITYTLYDQVEKYMRGQISEERLYEVIRKARNGELAVDRHHHHHIMLNLENFNNYFLGRIWSLIRFSEDHPIITSDSPVIICPIMEGQLELKGITFNSQDFLDKGSLHFSPMLLFPIGRTVGLILLINNFETDIEGVGAGDYDFEVPETAQLHSIFVKSLLENCQNEVYLNPDDTSRLKSFPKLQTAFTPHG